MTKLTGGYSHPFGSVRACLISIALRRAHGTLPEGPVDIYSWERPIYVYGERDKREAGSWRCYQWFAEGEEPPEGARFESRVAGERA